jgi:16S rRNA G966 N2-methylase RsmD
MARRAIFLDPPYATSGNLYAESSEGIAAAVREWCTTAPRELRIILCGYDTEHDALLAHGWTVTEGKAGRGAGYSVNPANGQPRAAVAVAGVRRHRTQPSLLEGVA